MKTSNKLLLGFFVTALVLIFSSFLIINHRFKTGNYLMKLNRASNAQKTYLKNYKSLVIDGPFDQDWSGVLYYDQVAQSFALAMEFEQLSTKRLGDTLKISTKADSTMVFGRNEVFYLPDFEDVTAINGILYYYPVMPEGVEEPEINLTLKNNFFRIGRTPRFGSDKKPLTDDRGNFKVRDINIKAHSSQIEFRQVDFANLHLDIDSVNSKLIMIKDRFSVDNLTGKIPKGITVTSDKEIKKQFQSIAE